MALFQPRSTRRNEGHEETVKVDTIIAHPPVFAGDEEQTRVASVLNIILLSLMAASAVYAVLALLVPAISPRHVLIAGPILFVTLVLLLVMRRGHVRLAGVALNASLWLIATVTVVSAGGVRAPAFGAYLIVVLTSGVLLGWRAALGTAGFSVVAGYVQRTGAGEDLLGSLSVRSGHARAARAWLHRPRGAQRSGRAARGG